MKASLTLRKLVLISNGTHFHLDFHLSLGLSCRVQKLGLAVLTTKKVSPGWTISGCQHSRRPMVKVIFMKLSVKHATKKVFQKYLKSEDVFLGGTESWSPPSWSTKWVTIQKWLSLTEVISSQPQIESLLVLLLLLELMNNEVLVSFLLNIRVKNVLILWLFRLCK